MGRGKGRGLRGGGEPKQEFSCLVNTRIMRRLFPAGREQPKLGERAEASAPTPLAMSSGLQCGVFPRDAPSPSPSRPRLPLLPTPAHPENPLAAGELLSFQSGRSPWEPRRTGLQTATSNIDGPADRPKGQTRSGSRPAEDPAEPSQPKRAKAIWLLEPCD